MAGLVILSSEFPVHGLKKKAVAMVKEWEQARGGEGKTFERNFDVAVNGRGAANRPSGGVLRFCNTW